MDGKQVWRRGRCIGNEVLHWGLQGWIQDFGKGGSVLLLSAKMQLIHALVHDVFFTLCEVWGSPKKMGVPDPQDPSPLDLPLKF